MMNENLEKTKIGSYILLRISSFLIIGWRGCVQGNSNYGQIGCVAVGPSKVRRHGIIDTAKDQRSDKDTSG